MMSDVEVSQLNIDESAESQLVEMPKAPPKGEGFHRHCDRTPIPKSLRGCVVAIGNFDGLHQGHQAVLEKAVRIARRRGEPVIVLTFEPHPRTIFRPTCPVARLTSAHQRAELLRMMSFDGVAEYPFDRDFARRTPQEFVQSVLIDWLGVSEVVTGHDFHFGKSRAGTPAYLEAAGRKFGFGVTLVKAYCDGRSQVISSTRIRNFLISGDVASAAALLGYRYTVEASVIRNPSNTAHRVIARLQFGSLVPNGNYSVRIRLDNGYFTNGIARIGSLKLANEVNPLVEIEVANDAAVTLSEVSTISFVRQTFPSSDEQNLRTIFEKVVPLSGLDQIMCFGTNGYVPPDPQTLGREELHDQ